jgi:hypothetical protein
MGRPPTPVRQCDEGDGLDGTIPSIVPVPETDRLVLRPWRDQDTARTRIFRVPEVMHHWEPVREFRAWRAAASRLARFSDVEGA